MTKGITGVALITGAAGGIGREAAFSFAEAGARAIAFADINEEGAKQASEKSKAFATNPEYRCLVLRVDVTDAASVQAMVDATVKEFGRIDYNVNSAGRGSDSSNATMDASIEEFDKIANVNTKGTMLCVRAVSKAMSNQQPVIYPGRYEQRDLGRGSIINLGSVMSYIGGPGKLPYCISKHAVIGITTTAALDNVPHRIRVNAVCPAWVDTPMMDARAGRETQLKGWIKQVSPAGRMAVPEEVADVIVFLCSPSASYINGQGFMVDAGLCLTIH
ncbi:MAG: hypothetical protein M1821_006488 [Bathelium mastoideum]|nr:MAG: hypothetical protein M1821_006488 [Bathelium mastoideum]KAI9693763.1 MAG: putative secondary metabolism biosynthetic enzyme [Bathelium mastoideum]